MQLSSKVIFLIFSFLSFNIPSQLGFAAGGITTDGTVGGINALNKPQQLKFKPDTTLDIAENLGTRSGGNLFHSFKEFNIPAEHTVIFKENVTKSTENVITRVTGKLGSDINGTLSVTPNGKANFYLINPNGVTFGPGGQVDVPGSIHISTADQLKFKDGKIFSAVKPEGNSLSSAVPAAFGFLGTSKENNGLIKIDRAHLKVNEAKAFDAVSGQIIIEGENIFHRRGFINNIEAVNGDVRLIAQRGNARINVEPDKNGDLSLPSIRPSDSNSGDIYLKNSFIEITNDNPGGSIGVWGNHIKFSNSHIISVLTNLIANSLLIENNSRMINSDVFEKSAGVYIKTSENFLLHQSSIALSGNPSRFVNGNLTIISGGDVIIRGETEENFSIFNYSDNDQNQLSGNISIFAKNNVVLKDGASISSDGLNPGNMNITAGKDIKVIGRSSIGNKEFFGSDEDEIVNNGDVTLTAKGNIEIIDKGQISTSAIAVGLKHFSGNQKLDAGRNLTISNGGKITSESFAIGKSGNIDLTVGNNLTINNSTNSSNKAGIFAITHNEGEAGNIHILAKGDIKLKGARVSSDTSGPGKGGEVTVKGRKILLDNASISAASTTQNSGMPGNVKVEARESLDLNRGKISIENSSETVNTETVSRLSVSAAKINLSDSQITTQATGKSPAGSIAIDFTNHLCLDSSFISTESKDGNGGALIAKGGTLIDLKNSEFKTTVSGIRGNGGDINVNADNVVLETALIQANTAAKQAKGGNINLNVIALIPSGNQLQVGGNEPITWQPGIFGFNVIQAAARFGLSGTIQSTAPILNLSGTLATLGSPKFDSSFLSPSYCSIGTGSSLTRLGKGGLPSKARDAWVY